MAGSEGGPFLTASSFSWLQGFHCTRGSVASGVPWLQGFHGARSSIVAGVLWLVAAAGAAWAQEGRLRQGCWGDEDWADEGPIGMMSPRSLGLTPAASPSVWLHWGELGEHWVPCSLQNSDL